MSNENIIEDLQTAVKMEMSAAHQYQLHAHVLDDWGLGRLAKQMRSEMTEELGHSDAFLDRIMFLSGTPKIELAKPPQVAGSLVEMFEMDLADEVDAIAFYIKAANNAAAVGDVGTRVLFERIALDEEEHKSWLETQLGLIQRLGEKTYSAKFIVVEEEEEEDDD
ncbi:bacterioferritin [Acuticoccus mangrovi]|uniref:Bacterioferritin n=1 Tax=Acuticoccus mangrovi TaxID=2796142 RepID=A0A934MD27_9HYPH|nr:bacterioferritin [Acuticoccus mangrovi]MBJ3775887.1 bacterioferritin [Acuticoccus mangrovi]